MENIYSELERINATRADDEHLALVVYTPNEYRYGQQFNVLEFNLHNGMRLILNEDCNETRAIQELQRLFPSKRKKAV